MGKKTMLAALLLTSSVLISACSGNNNGNGGNKAANGPSAAPANGSANGASPEGTSPPGSDLPLYTIKVFADPNFATYGITKSDQTVIGKVIKDKFNIVFEYITSSNTAKEQLNLMLAGGDYPEIMRIEDQDLLAKYIDSKALVPLDPYIENAPNFQKLFKDAIPYWKFESGDGKIYNYSMNLPQDMIGFPEHNDIYVRTDLLEQQGYPKLLSTDDYVEFFKKAKEMNPTTNGQTTMGMVAPFAEPWGMAGIAPVMYEKGGKYVQIANNAVIWSPTEDKFVDMLKDDYAVGSFKFLNKMYVNGLLDPDSFTDKTDQVNQKLATGAPMASWYISNWQANAGQVAAGHPELQYIVLPIQLPAQIASGEKRLKMTQATRPFDMVVITKNAKDPKRLFDLIEWASSNEGQLLLQSGIEGVHYTMENGKRVPTDEYMKNHNDPAWSYKQGFGAGAPLPSALIAAPDGEPYALSKVTMVKEAGMDARVKDTYTKLGWTDSEQWWRENSTEAIVGTAQSIFMDPNSEEGRLEQRLVEVRVRNTPKLIMAKNDAEFDKIYQDVLKEYEALKPETIVDLYNERYKAAKADLEAAK
ncbi:extracellular solute-binding protein [Paenibacillus sp. MWE-103]|uniref:Extracellular solute-binding protein n=1 Tax=Paenibacillus artemisiicola TaxID=1172618 RepID=A0ABS3W5W4_9BACL|nr:extracellular solute-binding protein [Paenibacillus artemisiicola]MBO7743690.1 extracellular solute-binding protein [Paenibacillus artemisiicola]